MENRSGKQRWSKARTPPPSTNKAGVETKTKADRGENSYLQDKVVDQLIINQGGVGLVCVGNRNNTLPGGKKNA